MIKVMYMDYIFFGYTYRQGDKDWFISPELESPVLMNDVKVLEYL